MVIKKISKRSKIMITLMVVVVVIVSVYAAGRIIRNALLSKDPKPILIEPENENDYNILFLHHSTGRLIYEGGVPEIVEKHNSINGTNYRIYEQNFPKPKPYGWHNYPYDYWNIWVNHAGQDDYKREPTLEMISKKFDLVIFKHCFPVSKIEDNESEANVSSDKKTLANYKLQYAALKEKLLQFRDTKFILWTPPALLEVHTTDEQAKRTKAFHDWVVNDWNEKADNIFLWDFYSLETNGGLFLRKENSLEPDNSHPSKDFAREVAPLLTSRIIDVAEGRGDENSITGR